MRLKISHTTRYRFDEAVTSGLQQLRKTPKPHAGQKILTWDTRIEGGKPELTFEDQHNNRVELISFGKGVTEVVVTSQGEVEIGNNNGVVGRHRGPAPLWLYRRMTPRTKAGPAVRALARGIGGDSDLDRAHALMSAISEGVTYEIGVTDSGSTAEETLETGKGVCQDMAHVFVACARQLGLSARYVSGYLMLNDREAQEAMHAWAEAHIPGLGWVGFDPSNCISPDDRYVRVATGLDYDEAAPVRGTRVGGEKEVLAVAIEVAQQ